MKEYLIIVFAILLVGLTACACAGQVEEDAGVENSNFDMMLKTMLKGSVPTMNVDELRENQEKFILLDSRERKEYDVSHLPRAIYVGYDSLEGKALSKLDKNRPVVVYCSIGVRSEKTGEKLREMGFKEVYNLYGSIFEWVNSGYPVVDSSGQETKQIHAYNRFWGMWMKNKSYTKVY